MKTIDCTRNEHDVIIDHLLYVMHNINKTTLPIEIGMLAAEACQIALIKSHEERMKCL